MRNSSMPAEQQLLQTYKKLIADELEEVFADIPGLLDIEISDQSKLALGRLREFSLRPGKRIRGSLTAFAYDYAAETKFSATGLRAGAAIELAQSYLLIIDDIMDKSDLRRGSPTLHELYRKEQKDTHLADMMALDVGLIAQHLLNLVMISIDEGSDHLLKALRLLHKNICITSFGQFDDLCQRIGQSTAEDDVIRKYAFKSSYYTFVNPIQVGLALGGVTDAHVFEEAETFGVAAGIAFQLQDDILGIFGNAAELGKSNLDDIKEGKYTLLLHHALEHGDEQEVRLLEQTFGNPHVTDRDMQNLQAVLRKTGSKAFVEDKAAWYAQQAKIALEASTFWNQTAQELFALLIDYAITRTK